MSGGIAESIAINLASELIFKVIQLGVNIVKDARVYAREGATFNTRLSVQIAIWIAIKEKFEDKEIQHRIRGTDLILYYNVMKELNGLLRTYVKRKYEAGEAKTKLLNETSVDDWFKKVEDQDILGHITEKEKEQSFNFWRKFSEEVAWTVWRKEKNEKLVSGIEEWGKRLQDLASWTIPSMFPEATKEEVTNHILDKTGALDTMNIKGRMIIARAGNSTSIDGLEAIQEVEERLFSLASTRVDFRDSKGFIRPPTPGPITTDEMEIEQEDKRHLLGGRERRQWAWLQDENGEHSIPVIVEFKAHVTHKVTSHVFGKPLAEGSVRNTWDGNMETQGGSIPDKKSLNNLVRTLRLAAQKPGTFHVMYCEGWYEQTAPSYFGLVYRLPPIEGYFRCESLGNILQNTEYKASLYVDLENRLKLARALAWTLFELHSVDWVHESLHPDNILLFGRIIGGGVHFDWSNPYVVGFDSSRSVEGVSGPMNQRAQWTSCLYTHPSRRTGTYVRFEKTHDIYSLGVVLLEIGRLTSLMEDKKFKISSDKLKENFIEEALNLPTVLGTTYRDVVLACLNGQLVDRHHKHLLTSEFRSRVCDKLDQIKVSH
jgi:hypothetical protein